jgi:DNA (cytosine-5)-methyltransferase 1
MGKKKVISVVELFAGVGGFRIGLEGWKGKSASSGFKKPLNSSFKVIWSNQWEPSTNTQHASLIYEKVFGRDGHINEDISKIKSEDIPEHDLLVGGFPCQDYSVARTLNQSAGLEGKKGVLWWEIHRIIKEKKNKPSYLLLENVDRLLKSPAKQRGRDFAIMLASLSDLGYIIEWRVINAAEYGMPQRRKRVFILAYSSKTNIYKKILRNKNPLDWVIKSGVFAKAFGLSDVLVKTPSDFTLNGELSMISTDFNKNSSQKSPFFNSGIVINRKVYSVEARPDFNGMPMFLRDVLIENKDVPSEFYIKSSEITKWKNLKSGKNEMRVNKSTGVKYRYTEGSMPLTDCVLKPSRTIVTGEGGSAPSRFKHLIKTDNGKIRRLTPIELERLNMFPDNHTAGASDVKRAFFMGNALVTGVVEKIGKSLFKEISKI